MPPTTPVPTCEEVADLRHRVEELEAQVARLNQLLKADPPGVTRWWRAQVGAFADDPAFEEIARLGREWRESQRAEAEAEADAQDRAEAALKQQQPREE